PNRRVFDDELARRFERWQKDAVPFTVLMLECTSPPAALPVGAAKRADELAHCVARLLAGALRELDQVARFASGQFAVLLPATAMHDGTRVAERIQEVV